MLLAIGLAGESVAQPFAPPATTVRAAGDVAAEQGISQFEKGDFRGAITSLSTAVKSGVDEYSLAEIYTVLGNAYYAMKHFDYAITCHKQALKHDPRFHQAWVNLGIAHRRKEEYDKAEECYRQALAIQPDYAEVHGSLGALYIFKKDAVKAIVTLEHAIKLDPTLAPAHANLALGYALGGRFDDADKMASKAVSLGYKNEAELRKKIQEIKDPPAPEEKKPDEKKPAEGTPTPADPAKK